MPIKRKKNKAVIKASIKLKSHWKPHYISVYLWNDSLSYSKHQHGSSLNVIKKVDAELGCFCSNKYFQDEQTKRLRVNPLLGEIHLMLKKWTTEIVAHELQHAILHRMRVLPPFSREVMKQVKSKIWNGHAEEDVCYDFGKWFEELYRWLWKVDAYGEHTKDR